MDGTAVVEKKHWTEELDINPARCIACGISLEGLCQVLRCCPKWYRLLSNREMETGSINPSVAWIYYTEKREELLTLITKEYGHAVAMALDEFISTALRENAARDLEAM